MDFLFELVPLVLIILWTVLGARASSRKKKPGTRGAERGTGPGRASTRSLPGAGRSGAAGRDRPVQASAPSERDPGGDSAAEMLPEDLWAVLTGQAPPSRAPERTQERTPAPMDEPTRYEDYDTRDETVESYDILVGEEGEGWLSQERLEHREQPEPGVVSLEGSSYDDVVQGRVGEAPTELELSDERHRRFHRRLDASAPVVRPRRGSAARRLGLRGRTDLRRAMVLTEVLGRPVALRHD